jgi:hypothetical protein
MRGGGSATGQLPVALHDRVLPGVTAEVSFLAE